MFIFAQKVTHFNLQSGTFQFFDYKLSKYLIENMKQLSDIDKSTRLDMIDLVNATFPRICPE